MLTGRGGQRCLDSAAPDNDERVAYSTHSGDRVAAAIPLVRAMWGEPFDVRRWSGLENAASGEDLQRCSSLIT